MTTYSNRIPKDFFITQGEGQSNITQHAGSYHLALRQAGIEACNIMTYSSILPGQAREVPQESYAPVHGEVMEAIMAVSHCTYEEYAIVGLGVLDLFDRDTDAYYGGLVAEFNFRDTYPWEVEEVHEQVTMMLDELYSNGYEHLRAEPRTMRAHQVKGIKKHATALIGLCFINHTYRIERSFHMTPRSAAGDIQLRTGTDSYWPTVETQLGNGVME